MSNVIPIEDGVKEWYAGSGVCIFCSYKGVMVSPARLRYVECPACGCMSVRKETDDDL